MAEREWSHVRRFDQVSEKDFPTAFASALRAGRLNRYSNVLANEKTLFPAPMSPLQPKHAFSAVVSEGCSQLASSLNASTRRSGGNSNSSSSSDVVVGGCGSSSSPAVSEGADYPYLCANLFSPSDFHDCPHTFIACQAPTPKQIEDFWLTMLQYQVPLILMLTRTFEGGNDKADVYWPSKLNTKLKLPTTGITIEMTSDTPNAQCKDLTERVIRVGSADGKITHTVKQVQFLGWPDFGVPSDSVAFEKLVTMCNDVKGVATATPASASPSSASADGATSAPAKISYVYPPIVVHCSAGIGRTGTLMGVYYGRHLLQKLKASNGGTAIANEVARKAVLDLVCRMKTTRTGMVQRPEQLQYIFNCLGL